MQNSDCETATNEKQVWKNITFGLTVELERRGTTCANRILFVWRWHLLEISRLWWWHIAGYHLSFSRWLRVTVWHFEKKKRSTLPTLSVIDNSFTGWSMKTANPVSGIWLARTRQNHCASRRGARGQVLSSSPVYDAKWPPKKWNSNSNL